MTYNSYSDGFVLGYSDGLGFNDTQVVEMNGTLYNSQTEMGRGYKVGFNAALEASEARKAR